MPALTLNLKGPTAPQEDKASMIGRSRLFCNKCFNLSSGSVAAALPERGLWAQTTTALQNSKDAELAGEVLGPAPEWAGAYRFDYAACEAESFLVDIHEAGAAGCETCAMIETVVTAASGGAVSFADPDLAANIIFCRGKALRVSVLRVSRDDEDEDEDEGMGGFGDFMEFGSRRVINGILDRLGVFELYTLPGQRTPWPAIGPSMVEERPRHDRSSLPGGNARHILPVPNDESCYALIKDWLDTCVNTHEACKRARTSQNRPLPKRVICVGPEDNTGIRLLETETDIPGLDRGDYPAYLALSHCWGASVHLDTRTATLADRRTNITWDSLPPTFRDAITVTRRLGFEYVWMDSLCIIQDDAQDWVNEAAKMASIYEGATLVLAATSSVDGDGGCLFPREPFVEVRGSSHTGEPFVFYGRKGRDHYAFNGDLNPNSLTAGSSRALAGSYPLFSRAWCFQERLLATRMLHFTAGEMVFDCLTGLECECGRLSGFPGDTLRRPRHTAKLGGAVGTNFFDGVEGTANYVLVRHKDGTVGHARRGTDLPLAVREGGDDFETWRDMVVQYSEKNITRVTDRLPALSGVASVWPGKTNGRYLAGNWEGDLLSGLLWYANKPNERGGPADYVAPSWSWASANNGISWVSVSVDRLKFFITVHGDRSGCELDTTDTFGRVRAGWLCVTGRVVGVELSSLKGDSGWVKRHGVASSFDPDNEVLCEEFLGKEVVCLRLSTHPPIVYDLGLILVPVVPGSEYAMRLPEDVREHEHVYRRIGLVKTYKSEEWQHETESEERVMYLV